MTQVSRRSVVARYALLPAALVVVLTLLLLALVGWGATDEFTERSRLRNQHQAFLLAQAIDDALRGSVREVRLLARSPLMTGGASPARVRAELEALRAQSSRYVWLGLVALDGTVIAGTRGWLEGGSIANRPVFAQSRTATWLGDVHPAVALAPLLQASGEDTTELIDIGEPVRDDSGRVVAVLAAHLGVAWIDALRRQSAGDAVISQSTGTTAHLVSGPAWRNVLSAAPPPDIPPTALESPRDLQALDGRHYIVASRGLTVGLEISPLPWRVLVLQERGAALAPVTNLMRSVGVIGAVLAALVALVGTLWARRVLQPWSPVFDLVAARSRDTPGGLTTAESIEALLADLNARGLSGHGPEALLARLARDARSLRRVVDHVPVGVAVIDRQWRVEYLNAAYTRLLGWTTEQVRGRITGEFLLDAVERADHQRLIERLDMAPAEVAMRFDALSSAGQRVAVQWHLVPLLGADGRFEGAIAVVQDIRAERLALARADALAGRLRALADAAVDDLLATLDGEGRVLEWSRGAERLTGQSAADAMGRRVGDMLHAGAAWQDWLIEARRHGVCALHGELMTADGRLRWFEGSLYALGLASGPARLGLILRDVTEQREVHQALEASEARLRLAFEAAQIGTWEVDLAGGAGRLTWSPGYARYFDLDDDRMPRAAADVIRLIHEDDREAMRAAFRAMVRDDVPLRAEFRVGDHASTRWHAVRGRAMRDAAGRATRLIGVGMDVTARRQAELELERSRARLEHILQTMAEGLMISDADGRFTMVNAAAAQICGVDAAALVGLPVDRVPWRRRSLDQGELVEHPHARFKAGGQTLSHEEWMLERSDGQVRAISLNARALHDPQGRYAGVVATFVDITDRHEAQVALRDSQARLSAVVASASDAIISTDLDGRVALFNPAAERIFGVDAAHMAGAPLNRLLPPSVHARHTADMRAFAASGTSRRSMAAGRVQGRHVDGRLLELEASISQAEVHGQTVLTAILRDVTERVAQERALETTRAELLHLTRQLLEQEKQTTRRLAQALHDELGQTLTALRLHWEALRESPAGPGGPGSATGPVADRVNQLVVTAHRQIRSVLGDLRPPLLDDFGLVPALDNEMQQHRPVDGVPQLVLDVVPRLQAQRWPADVEYAAFMIAREALLNALHHAQARLVTLTIDGDEGELLMTVRDDGVGVPPAARAGRPGHLGLVGMRERALAIGARLDLDSTPGHGTIVTLTWTLNDEPAVPDR